MPTARHDLPGLVYTKDISLTETSAIISYEGITEEHFNDIVSISKSLADSGIGPSVVDGGYFFIEFERCYPARPSPEQYQSLVDKLAEIGICHGDIVGNVMKTRGGVMVLIDTDQSFYIGRADKHRLNAYSSRYSFEDEDDLEKAFIDHDSNTLMFLD